MRSFLSDRKQILSSVSIVIFFLHFSPVAIGQTRQGKSLNPESIIYNGIDNLLVIDSSLFRGADTLIVLSNNGTILSDTCNRYLCIPKKLGTMWISVYALTDNDTSLLGYKYFLVLNIPEPLLTINGRPLTTPAEISKNELLNCDSLGVYFSDDIAGSDHWMTITEFSIGYSYGGFYVSHFNLSNKFTQETKEIIYRLGPDREISIRPIVKAEGNIMKPLPIYRIRIY
jgi:hypothetical protein